MKFPHKPHPKDICECHHSRKEHNKAGCLHIDDYEKTEDNICPCKEFKEHLLYMEGKETKI